ncbi:MAG: hypothetical protein M3N39_07990, partial [Pseudomonadota bacterium]|nr:hypothetical protein [Pseudomonadota bacterium]
MKILLKILAVASAFGLVPAAASAQSAAPAQTATPAQRSELNQQPQGKGAPASDAISARTQARGGAQPQEVSDPNLADTGREEPSDAQV